MNFNVLEKADITQQDFADIIGISRVALNKLIHNGNIERIEKGLHMLDALVSAGKLPRGYSRTDKASREALTKKLKERFDIIAS